MSTTIAELITRATEYLDSIEAEGRDLTDDEQREHDGMLATITRRQKIDTIMRTATHTEGPDGVHRIGDHVNVNVNVKTTGKPWVVRDCWEVSAAT
jgi:hypothetical protein